MHSVSESFVSARSGFQAISNESDVKSAKPGVVGSSWYVAEVHPKQELVAVENLARQGFQTFFPRFRKRQTGLRRKEAVLCPAFPGYLFVAFDISINGWTAINSTRGVKRLIGSNPNKPQPVPSAAMALLRNRCHADLLVNISEYLAPGDHVKIFTGPLANRIAKIDTLPSVGRVSILFEIMGTQQSLELNISDVGPIAA